MPLAIRPGLPAATSVVAQKELMPARSGPLAAVAPGGSTLAGAVRTYRILRTNEVDPKDAPVAVAAITPFVAARATDNFSGTARKVAKLSISGATVEMFTDVQDL